mmetsp:Transcript_71610/g.209895  ORF Transcript_71610/g.209895 Transcript_71610/m.209895 type:complete len:356 (+) Transcript_71610:20-1087(+)
MRTGRRAVSQASSGHAAEAMLPSARTAGAGALAAGVDAPHGPVPVPHRRPRLLGHLAALAQVVQHPADGASEHALGPRGRAEAAESAHGAVQLCPLAGARRGLGVGDARAAGDVDKVGQGGVDHALDQLQAARELVHARLGHALAGAQALPHGLDVRGGHVHELTELVHLPLCWPVLPPCMCGTLLQEDLYIVRVHAQLLEVLLDGHLHELHAAGGHLALREGVALELLPAHAEAQNGGEGAEALLCGQVAAEEELLQEVEVAGDGRVPPARAAEAHAPPAHGPAPHVPEREPQLQHDPRGLPALHLHDAVVVVGDGQEQVQHQEDHDREEEEIPHHRGDWCHLVHRSQVRISQQ